MANHYFNYSQILRAIGNDLEMRGLKAFEICNRDDRYTVRCGYQSPPAVTPLVLEYSLDDIEELDLGGEENRSTTSAPVDFCKLSQMLRTVGGYLDQKRATLLRISNNESPGKDVVFRLEYETGDREHIVEDRTQAQLYDIGVHLYKQRGKLTKLVANSGGWWR